MDLARDRWVVAAPDDPDRLIADGGIIMARNTDRGYVFTHIHPDWQRRGLGSALLGRSLARARELGLAYVISGADEMLSSVSQMK